MKAAFTEEQKFNQWWLWLIINGICVIALYGAYKQIILGETFGSSPMSSAGIIAFVLFAFAFAGMFLWTRLSTKIDSETIEMNYVPFLSKSVKWEEVATASVVDYGFIGGWGIRFTKKYGKVYNTRGKMGLAIVLKNGDKFLIGTQKESELSDFVTSHFSQA